MAKFSKLAHSFAAVRGRLQAAISARSPRERAGLALAVAVVLSALAYQAYDFIDHDRQRIARELPRQKVLLTTMQREAAELERLRGLPAPPAAPASQKLAAAQSAAEARGLKLVLSVEDEAIKVEGDGDHAALVGWLADIAEHESLYPTALSLRRDVQSGGGRLSIVGRLESVAR